MPSDAPTSAEKVLVIDDDEHVLRALQNGLRRLGYDVVLAKNGAEGFDMALKVRPHVILADIRMPEMDGHTLLRRLGASEVDAAVVMMSAHGSMVDVIEVLRQGAVDYLKKPWAASELVAAIGRAAEINQKRRALPGIQATQVSNDVSPRGEETAERAESRDPRLEAVMQRVKRGEIGLPPLPAILGKLRALVASPDTQLKDIVALIEREPAMAMKLLKLANSAHYSGGARSDDVGAAVSRVGLRSIQSMVETLLLHDAHAVKDTRMRSFQLRIWRYSVARAISMRGLAELMGDQVEPEVAYLGGLLSDIGALLLIWLFDQEIGAKMPTIGTRMFVCAMRDQHTELGALLLKDWGVDPVATLLARTHHLESPPAPPSDYWSLMVLGTALADQVTNRDDVTRLAPLSPELVDRCGASLRIGTSTASKVLESLRREFDSIVNTIEPAT